MFCSTIIPTIGRASLAQAVCGVLGQQFDAGDYEVIVVNDSGKPLPEQEWQSSGRVRVIETQRRERSVARNTGAAVARGRYFHFLDDDDMLLPGALAAFRELAQSTDAAWLYGGYQTADNDGRVIEELHADFAALPAGNISAFLIAGESIPLQASLLRADQVFRTGAFCTWPVGTEDRDLGRRLGLDASVAGTPAVVARIRVGRRTSTTDWSAIAGQDRWSREKALRLPGAYGRLWASARTGYWRGRVARASLASAAWNVKRGAGFTATSRVAYALAVANWRAFTPSFWRGLGVKIQTWPEEP
jgi:glycosyltransferase involved in cell wall biosynthesis